jgi:Protein of unknown function (DUF3034)
MVRLFIAIFCIVSTFSSAQALDTSGKLLLTGGVNTLEGSAGGGLTPWAFIGGYGTKDQIGANAYYTNVNISDYKLESTGAVLGIMDRVELSFARQTFDMQKVSGVLGLGNGYKIKQNVAGIKIKLLGDGVLDQASWLPQISIGAQYKKNQEWAVVKSIGAADDHGIDYYINATKIFLNQSILANATLRATKANQLGILGFGGNKNDNYKYMFEGSLGYLLTRQFALGVEYRMKPDNLNGLKENSWRDIFVAWAPTKNVTLTAAYTMLGNIAIRDNQSGFYSSLQIGF